MKASKFILNTDYITPQNQAEGEITIFVPSSIYVPKTEYKRISQGSITLGKSASEGFRVYITSTAFNYAITGVTACAQLAFGNEQLILTIQRTKTTYTFSVSALASPSNRTITGTGQNLTAHIQTFVDPFEV